MKTVGILGGLGPSTTAEFYIALNRIFFEKKIPAKPPIIISNIPLPFQVEEDALIRNEGIDRYLPFLIKEAVRLEKAGADFMVLPCNSMHVYIGDIRNAVTVPVLSIIEESVSFIQKMKINRLGIISTAITLKFQLYENHLKQHGIEYISPADEDQVYLNQLIFDIVNGTSNGEARENLNRIISDFEHRGIEHVLLACTDLQELKPSNETIQIHDSMKIFVDSTVDYMISGLL
jgi:aspartate racemase